MSILHIPLTLYGSPISGIAFPVGATVDFDLTCQDPSTHAPIDLASSAVVMAVNALDPRGNPTFPALISHQATITDHAEGKCTVPFTSGDTVPTLQTPFHPGKYGFDIWLTDGSGNRLQLMSYGTMELTPAASLPGSPITPGPSQSPLALGPTGATGPQGPAGPAGSSLVTMSRTISQPSDGTDFRVTISPVLSNNTYSPQSPVIESSAIQVFFTLPNGSGDRTTSSLRVQTSAPLNNGDVITISIQP